MKGGDELVTKKVTITLPIELSDAARDKSHETGIPVSTAIQRLLAGWIETGELPPAQPIALPAVAKKATKKATPKGGKRPTKKA